MPTHPRHGGSVLVPALFAPGPPFSNRLTGTATSCDGQLAGKMNNSHDAWRSPLSASAALWIVEALFRGTVFIVSRTLVIDDRSASAVLAAAKCGQAEGRQRLTRHGANSRRNRMSQTHWLQHEDRNPVLIVGGRTAFWVHQSDWRIDFPSLLIASRSGRCSSQ